MAFLLQRFAEIEADKQYQLADWRVRPLLPEMLKYARQDTHYLLYIYDMLRQELIQKANGQFNLLQAVVELSKETSLYQYEKQFYNYETGEGPGGWKSTLKKWNLSLRGPQLAVFRNLHHWRDKTAREHDESTNYVMKNSMLFAIANRMPEDAQQVLGCCQPTPPLVRMLAQEIALLVQKAKLEVEQSPVDFEEFTAQQPAGEPVFEQGEDNHLPEATLDPAMVSLESNFFGDALQTSAEPAEKAQKVYKRINNLGQQGYMLPFKRQKMLKIK